MAYNNNLPKKSENLSDWYNTIVLQAELADYGPAKGTMIFRPYGYAIWEELQKKLDGRIKEMGVDNVYFPLLIPESLLNKEKEHIEGFSPELAVVTVGGGEELSEKLVIRPTSETIMYDTFSRWINSWRDLPLQINQWANVVRWEKRTYLFLRTSEFLWQEGHTAHATHEQAFTMVQDAMNTYKSIFEEQMALPGIIGKKSETEKFAGADLTLTYETLMPEGKALQSATSHDLGQNFSKSFGIEFQNREGAREAVWQTSWGLSTRAVGGMLMAHGDDRGLRLPPRMAPVQVVILPVRDEEEVVRYCEELLKSLRQAGVRVKLDNTDDETIGRRINKWQLKGVPVHLEIGGQEVAQGEVTVGRRDRDEKIKIRQETAIETIQTILEDVQRELLAQAQAFLAENTHKVNSWEEFQAIMNGRKGFLYALWCEDAACEQKIKEESKASTRCLPLDAPEEAGNCVHCGSPAKHRWYFAQAY